jgi:hypothetical protein
MVAGYEREASQWFEGYYGLEDLRARGIFSAKKYAAIKAAYDRYKAALLDIREALTKAVLLVSATKRQKIPQQAREGYCFAVVCKSCGELKRRKYRSDALQWQREHRAKHPRHEVGIIERPMRNAKKTKAATKAQTAQPRALK